MSIETTLQEIETQVETTPIRDLVERYPAVMPVLSGYGMDLCCGGGHTVPEAARLHGLDVAQVVAQVRAVIIESRG